jgi:dynein heavy chain 2
LLVFVSSITSLKAIVFADGGCEFTTSVSAAISYEDQHTDILFVKRSFDPITPTNISSCLDVHTIHGSPLDGLYNTLKGVFCPTLLEGEWKDKMPPKIHQLLTDLEKTLSTSVRSDLSTDTSGPRFDISNVSGITSPMDEIDFWNRLKDDKRQVTFKELARRVSQAYSVMISPGFADLDSLDMASVEEFLPKVHDALEEAWKPNDSSRDRSPYPQRRMEHLFDCIGSALCRYIQQKLSNINVWKHPSGEVRLRLQDASRVCRAWCEIPEKLTSTFWSGGEFPWKGEPHRDNFMRAFKDRLEHVLKIRTLSDELSQMLTPEERVSYQLDRLFVPLEDTKPLYYNPYTEPQWARAVAEYEQNCIRVESAVATHLKSSMSSILDRPQLLLREFQKYKNLLERPTIRHAMVSQREALLPLLRELVRKIESSVDRIEAGGDDSDDDAGPGRGKGGPRGSNGSSGAGKLLTNRIAGIVQLRQLSAKVASILSTSQGILNDLDGFAQFAGQCQNLISRMKSEENSRFEAWKNETVDRIESDDSAFRLQGSLMGWKDGMLTVNFSEDLVRLLREVRQLDELGFEIPKAAGRNKRGIMEKALEAEKYYRYGILLKKTANFYNSISEQMIDVQEQLLLDSLSAFASIVTKSGKDNSGDVSWSNPAECENYIRVLQEAAETLSSENRQLRKVHETLIAHTVQLMNIDFLRQKESWVAKWRVIKEKMTAVRNKYGEKNAGAWILHWDHQIYKALEASYQMGLESLNENLPEMKIELVFANKRVEFKPPMEQLRQNYYSEMRKFVAMPNSFEGFGNAVVYRKMGVRNSKRLIQVYNKAESLFDKLSMLMKKYEVWASLGTVDIDQFIEANCTTPDEYIANFKTLRIKRKDIDKLPDVEKVDCCTVVLTPFKGFLEDLFQRVQDSLLVSLRRSLLQEFKDVDNYLDTSNQRLSSLPNTVAEIGEAKKQWKEIDAKKDTMKSISRACVEKKKLLFQYAPGTAVDISEVSIRMANLDGEGGRWDEFDINLEAFNDLIEGAKDRLKGTLDENVVTLNMSIDKFGNRWRQLKPGDVKNWEYSEVKKIFAALEDWKQQFQELSKNAENLIESCMTFGMPRPRFDGLDALSTDIENTTKSWDMLKQYHEELKVISDQDWLTFSVNVYALQDFAVKWAENLKATLAKGSYDAVTEHIMTTVERIKRSVPALKYCQGEPFKEDHWTELLQGKLQMAKDIRKDNVRVEHFLQKLDILMEPQTLTFVKNLQARALGEVQIREALQELRAWERSAEIKLLTPEESGRRLPLIKDWKDLFLEMGDKQSLLGSLKESQFFKAFADQGLALEAKMSVLDFVLHTLNSIQRKWVYLEPIFSRGALPSEEGRFKRVDEDFTDIMTGISRDPKLFYLADEQIFPQISDKLRTMLDQLERCQKALTDFLEAKRSAMPRFYFIGDDDLLEILGQAKNPNVIQSHLKKLFQGIHKVKFNENCSKITAMISSSNEVVPLDTPVTVSDKVEDWLEQLAQEMRATLSSMLSKYLNSGKMDWSFPSQVICLGEAIKFTDAAENAIEEGRAALDDLCNQLKSVLREVTSHDLSSEPLLQLKTKSLIFDIVHNIDVIEQLQRKKTGRLTEWTWKKQLRYYYENSKAVVRMHDAKFDYTYEYQGNAPKLVHTPLTDKCYLTLTQGMHMGFGGNPYGPAGTGKTESVKALSSCLGRQVLVFNCDEALER